MFATLLGALPQPDTEREHGLELVVRAQEEAGLEPITDGRLGDPGLDLLATAVVESAGAEVAVARWQATQRLTDRAVKLVLPGPYTLGRRLAAKAAEGKVIAFEAASALHDVIGALAAAGCALVEIEETADTLGDDERERQRFSDAHHRLAEASTGTHLSLSIVGGAPAASWRDAILAALYQSLAVDLIAGPDSWSIVTGWPGDRGVIAGAESASEADEPKEVLLWAAHYAASTKGRGLDRVGLGSAGSYAHLPWDAAVRKMQLLGVAARLATLPPGDDLARSLDPRAVDIRRAAMGHDAPGNRLHGSGDD